VLGRGEVTKPLTVRVHAFSRSAAEAIRAAGGTVETLVPEGGLPRPPARGNALTNR
jgi:ribosomal protein L18E